MAKTPAKLDDLPKVQRWLGKAWGMQASIADVVDWLEHDEVGQTWKSNFTRIVIRDAARLGSPEDLRKLQGLGYDLSTVCSYQVDGNALHVAVQHGKHGNTAALLEMGLTTQTRVYSMGPSALDEAIINGHLGLFEKLLKHTPPVSQEDKDLWLLAAMSTKTRKPQQSTDKAKKKTVDYVLEKHGPFSQEVLDKALYHASHAGWLTTFKTLVDAGANPALSSMMFVGSVAANSLLALFSKLDVAQWPYAVSLFEDKLDLLSPQPKQGKPVALGLSDVFEQCCVKNPSLRAGPIPDLIEGLAARRRSQALNDSWQALPAPVRSPRM